MNKVLSPGEMSVGMFVTVLENKPFIHEPLFPSEFIETKTIVNEDRSGMGDIHTILAIEIPYIVVRREGKYECSRFVYNVDTRRTTLMECSREYVEALCPFLVNKQDS